MEENNQAFIDYEPVKQNFFLKIKERLPLVKIAVAFSILCLAALLLLAYFSYRAINLKMDRMEQRLGSLAEVIGTVSDTPVSVSSVQERIAKPEAEEAVEKDAAREPVVSPPAETQLLPLVVAASQLQEMARKGLPFQRELQRLEQTGDPVIGEKVLAMKPYAQTGVKTVEQLRDSFAALVTAIAASKDKAAKESGIMRHFSSVIKIRKLEEKAGEAGSDAVIASAEKAMAASDIGAAIQALDKLADEDLKNQALAWLTDAGHSKLVIENAAALYEYYITASDKGNKQ